jgi:hypothetical protein
MVIHVGTNHKEARIKVVLDKDSLPPDITDYRNFHSTADREVKADVSQRFWQTYDHMRFMEAIGYHVCIDFDSHFYETGGQVEVT